MTAPGHLFNDLYFPGDVFFPLYLGTPTQPNEPGVGFGRCSATPGTPSIAPAGLGSHRQPAGLLTVGRDDLKAVFRPRRFYNSMIFWVKLPTFQCREQGHPGQRQGDGHPPVPAWQAGKRLCVHPQSRGRAGSVPPQAVCTHAPTGVPAFGVGGVLVSLQSGRVGAWSPARLRCTGARRAARVPLLVSGRKTDVALVKLFLIRHA